MEMETETEQEIRFVVNWSTFICANLPLQDRNYQVGYKPRRGVPTNESNES